MSSFSLVVQPHSQRAAAASDRSVRMASASSDLATSLSSLVGLRRPSFSSRSSSLLPLLPSSSPPRSLRASSAVSSSSPRRSFLHFTDPGISASPSTVYGRRKLQGRPFATPTETGEYSDFRTMIPPDDRIPATIITGFLGSGKTTLLNHILTADHGKKIAVIENEYGEVDIDGALVATKTVGADDIIMLNNGCLCCTVRSDLVRMIAELVDKRKGKFDHIVIETTGLANPAPIIQTFYLEDKIFKNVKLDGVVTLVDAKNVNFHLDDIKPKGVVNEAVEQIAYADRILVNKIDLVGEHEIASLVQRIKKMNGLADLKETKFGQVNLEYVLGIGGFDLERIENDVKAEILTEFHDDGHGCNDHNHDHGHHTADENHVHGHGHDHVHGHGHDHVHGHGHDHVHDPGVSSVSIVCEGSLDPDKADMFMGMLLLERSQDMYRMKGILSINGMNERFVFQGVHDIFQGSPDRPWHPDERRVNKIVFIGKNLDSGELEKGFKACLV